MILVTRAFSLCRFFFLFSWFFLKAIVVIWVLFVISLFELFWLGLLWILVSDPIVFHLLAYELPACVLSFSCSSAFWNFFVPFSPFNMISLYFSFYSCFNLLMKNFVDSFLPSPFIDLHICQAWVRIFIFVALHFMLLLKQGRHFNNFPSFFGSSVGCICYLQFMKSGFRGLVKLTLLLKNNRGCLHVIIWVSLISLISHWCCRFFVWSTVPNWITTQKINKSWAKYSFFMLKNLVRP